MSKKEKLVVCNKCGHKNKLENNFNLVCVNCKNEINIDNSKVIGIEQDTTNRLMYEIENKLINSENYYELLKKANDLNISNDLIKYLNQKNNKEFDLSWLKENTKYYNLIIKDIMRNEDYSNDQRISIIKTLNANQELLLSMMDETIYKSDESKAMVKELANQKINIVKNAPRVPYDFFKIKMFIGITSILVVFLIGFMFEKDFARPIVILLSLFPAIYLSLLIGSKIKKNKLIKVLADIGLFLVLFFVISYVESIRYVGFVSIKEHLINIINAVPDFATELLKRIDVFEEIKEPGDTPATDGE